MTISHFKKGGHHIDKKERIIQAAIDVFSEKGIEKTTVSAIVKKAGIAQGTYYLYFDSKLSVMPAIAEVMMNKTLTRLQSDVKTGSIENKLETIIDVIFDTTDEYKTLTKLIYAGLSQTQYVGDWEEIYTPLYKWFSSVLQEAQAEGSIDPDINIIYTSKILLGTLESAAEQVYLYDSTNSETVEAHKVELHNFISNALRISK